MKSVNKTAQKDTYNLSKILSILVYGLLAYGILVIFSSTYVTSSKLYNIPWYYAAKQIIWVTVGFLAFLFFYNIKFSLLKKFSFVLNIFVLFCLSILAISGILPCSSSISIAPCINGANRWLELPFAIPFIGTLNFQPAELAKLSIVLYLSFLLKDLKDTKKILIVYGLITFAYSILIFLQPNLSTLLILVSISTGILFLHLNDYKTIFSLISVLLIVLLIAAFSEPYRIERIKTHFSSGNANQRGLKEDYHVRQISIAIGSGGFSGLGFGQSMQKYSYLPEVATDSIFAIISEEGGFIFSFATLTAYMLIILIAYLIALNSKDSTHKLISSGILIWFSVQVFINIFSMVRIIPLTGVPLPLISYGGSSLVFMMSALGILANIAKKV